ncbi:MAG: endonuclease domain-containing protein [Actinomycetota bacterium]
MTTPGRTLLDVCSRHPHVAETILDTALREGLIHIDELRDLVERASAHRLGGVAKLRALTDVRGDGDALSESELESIVLRLLRSVAYPSPQQQVPIDIGGRLGRVDFFYPHANLVIEVDGHRWHAGRRRQIEDQRRDHSLLLQGLRVLRFTWEDVTRRPDYFLEVVGEALGIVSSNRAQRECR